MELKEYWPRYLQDLIEFEQIAGSEQPEFMKSRQIVQAAPDDFFFESLSDYGCRRWEAILGLSVGDGPLEERRARIKAMWNTELPYTYRWLTNWLRSLCGVDNPAPTIDGYSIQIKLPSGVDYLRILDDLRQRIPANLVIAPCVQLVQAEAKLYVGAAVRIAAKQTLTVGAAADNLTAFMDESDAVLTDEGDKILYVEATP